MSKLGLRVRIDLSKIDKSSLFKVEKGIYLDLTTFIDLGQQDKYGNNGFISQSTSKDERQSGVQTPILGNVKVFYNDVQQGRNINSQQNQQGQSGSQSPQDNPLDFDDDIPF